MMTQSSFFKQAKGHLHTFTTGKYNYRNDKDPEDNQNIAVLDFLMKLDIDLSLIHSITPFLNQYIKYSRCVILESILSKIPNKHDQDLSPKFKLIQEDIKSIIKVLEDEERI